MLSRRDHAQDPLDRLDGRMGVQGAEHHEAGLGGLDRRGEGVVIADFADQNHIGVFAQRRAQGLVKLPGGCPTSR